MERDGKKFGIGSSGSVTLLTLKALSAYYQITLTPELLFKLAAYTLLKQGDNGSMGDIACIAYQTLVAYTSFDREQVSNWLQTMPLKNFSSKIGVTISKSFNQPCLVTFWLAGLKYLLFQGR